MFDPNEPNPKAMYCKDLRYMSRLHPLAIQEIKQL